MKYDKFIVSFSPGSGGRFVAAILDRIALQIDDPIYICPYNSAHFVARKIPGFDYPINYTGISSVDPNCSNIYELLEFDDPPVNFKTSLILSTHTYPDFELINKKFENIGIIIITLREEDMKEVVFNSSYKNQNIHLDDEILEIRSKKLPYSIGYRNFLKDQMYPSNCLTLPYADIFTNRLLDKLKNFLEVDTIPESVLDAHASYISGRTMILDQQTLR